MSAPQPAAGYIACVGELMWDLHTMPGATFERDLRLQGTCAGAAANVACALTDAGYPAAVLGQIANDALGKALRAQLEARGVNVGALMMSAGRCGLVLIEHQQGGGMRCVAYPPRRERLKKSLRLPPGRCLALHIGALETDRHVLAAHAQLARRVRAAGGWVMVDLNVRPRMWRDRTLDAGCHELIGAAHFVKASSADLAVLGMSSAPGRLDKTRGQLGCLGGTLLVTRGERSSSASGAWGSLRRAVKLSSVRNTVGAGDAFCAGVLSELRQYDAKQPLDRAKVLKLVETGHIWAQLQVSQPPPGSDAFAS